MRPSSSFLRLCTQDRDGFYEEIRIENGQYHYFLFDSPHKPWKSFESFEDCKRTIQDELKQPLLQFHSAEAYTDFIRTIDIQHDWLWVDGHKVPTYTSRISDDAIVLIDTGKDWISLRQDSDLTFYWEPQQDPLYRNLGEKLVTIQDAIRKIEDMPITLFNREKDAASFFSDTYPKPKLLPIKLIIALIVCGLSLPIFARTMTIEDVLQIKRVRNVMMSPNGTRAAYLKDNVLWMVDISDPKHPIHTSIGTGTAPQWLSDSSGIAYLKKSQEKKQLFIYPLSEQKSQLVCSSNTGILLFCLNPDPTLITFVTEEKTATATYAVHLFNLNTKTKKILARFNQTIRSMNWDPQGKQLVISNVSPTPENQLDSGTYIFNTQTATLTPISLPTLPNEPLFLPRWTPDGKKIVFYTSDGFPNTWLNSMQIGVFDLASKQTTLFPQTLYPGLISVYGYCEKRHSIVFLAEDGVTYALYELNLDSKSTIKMSPGTEIYEEFSFSRTFNNTIFLMEDATHPPELYTSSYPTLKPQKVSSFNTSLSELNLGETEVIHWKSKDGTRIEGLLIKPIGYVPGKTYPLITWLHGGPASGFSNRFSNGAWHYPTQVLAAEGFMVFMPNPRGSTGYGPEFKRALVKQWGEIDSEDVLTGIEFLITEKKGVDPNRLGICGWSYGGYLTGVLVAKTDRFKCASIGAGFFDLSVLYSTIDIPDWMEAYLERTAAQDPERYKRHSSINALSNKKVPLLIQHGELDTRVPVSQARLLKKELESRNGQFNYIEYAKESHILYGEKNKRDSMQENVNWFKKYLF